MFPVIEWQYSISIKLGCFLIIYTLEQSPYSSMTSYLFTSISIFYHLRPHTQSSLTLLSYFYYYLYSILVSYFFIAIIPIV